LVTISIKDLALTIPNFKHLYY